jgi:hypothetical protein
MRTGYPAGTAYRSRSRAGGHGVPGRRAGAVHGRVTRAGRRVPGAGRLAPGAGRQGEAGAAAGTYSNQSKATSPSVAYIPMTRPVKPQATSVDR